MKPGRCRIGTADAFRHWLAESRLKRSAADQQAVYWLGHLGPILATQDETIAWLEAEVTRGGGEVMRLEREIDEEKPTRPLGVLALKLEQARRERDLVAAVREAAKKGLVTLTQERGDNETVYLANRVRHMGE